ncbi:MAG: hypothetical protein ACR2RB_02610, partial [Gammaproteobacteria bacterium]
MQTYFWQNPKRLPTERMACAQSEATQDLLNYQNCNTTSKDQEERMKTKLLSVLALIFVAQTAAAADGEA